MLEVAANRGNELTTQKVVSAEGLELVRRATELLRAHCERHRFVFEQRLLLQC